MKKTEMMVLAMVAVMLIGLGGPVWGKGEPKDIFNRGITIIHDQSEDVLAEVYCADIENARITEVGRDLVDLSITPVEAIPEAPEEAFLAYFWQFQGTCSEALCTEDPTAMRNALVAIWEKDGDEGAWSANWAEIYCCEPMTDLYLDPETKLTFEEGGVRVRTSIRNLDDFFTQEAGEEYPTLKWFAGVRLVPFIDEDLANTAPVDVVPEVYNDEPEALATWEGHEPVPE